MEPSIEAECRFRLRSLSVGSEVFTESDSILLQTSCHSIQEQGKDESNESTCLILYLFAVFLHCIGRLDIDTGPRIGKGGFSDIIEVKNLKYRSGSIESEASAQTCDTQDDSASGCASVDSGFMTSESLIMSTYSNQVYADSKPRQHFVLKTVRKDLPGNKEACGRLDLAIEAQFLQTLSHPNIVSLHGFGEEPGDPCFFIVIERIDRTLGNELGNWLMNKQRMKLKVFRGTISKKEHKDYSQHSISKCLAVAYQLTSALKYLHRKK
jgi:serine/threonine protein kinase